MKQSTKVEIMQSQKKILIKKDTPTQIWHKEKMDW